MGQIENTPPLKQMKMNPIYDEVITIFSPDYKIPTRSNKNREFQKLVTNHIKETLGANRKERNIYTDKLLLSIHIFGSEEYIKKTDTDNFAKFILDALKGLLFEDDNQIYTLMVFKEVGKGDGLWIGVKKFDTGMPAYPYFPLLTTADMPLWSEEFYNAAGKHMNIF